MILLLLWLAVIFLLFDKAEYAGIILWPFFWLVIAYFAFCPFLHYLGVFK